MRRLGARAIDQRRVQPQDRRHRPGADRDRLLHVAAAAAGDAQRVGKRERLRRHVRRVLAEAVSGDKRRPDPARLEQPERRHAHREDGGLRVLRQREPVLGAVEDQPAERLAERGVGLVERPAADRKGIGQSPAHARLLATLAGEQTGDHSIRNLEFGIWNA